MEAFQQRDVMRILTVSSAEYIKDFSEQYIWVGEHTGMYVDG
jgi:hypothetical protein